MILFIGQIERDVAEREAFQEIDYRRMFGQSAKWVAQIDHAERLPEFVNRAFATATSGRPGPVVLALPEDMLRDRVSAPSLQPYRRHQGYPGSTDMATLGDLIRACERPLLVVGGGTWNADAKRNMERFASRWHLPAVCSYRCQDYFDNYHDLYAGHLSFGVDPRLAAAIRNADLLIVAGPRLGEITTSGYTLFEAPVPKQRLIHVHPAPEELGRVYQPVLGIAAGLPEFAEAAARLEAPADAPWREWSEQLRSLYLDLLAAPTKAGLVDLRAVVMHMQDVLPEDTIVANGAGNYTIWVHRFFRFRHWRSQLAPTSGAMGYGVPAAIAAALVHPDRTVVSVSGDGCFLMAAQELATVMYYRVKPIFLVINNGCYGTIRMHQELNYPGQPIGTDLSNPDFAAFARSFGAHGETVTRTEDFAPALERARASGRAALIEIQIDKELITPTRTLSEISASVRR
jgi:acetolactate synthase-1/2/3 large subunit